MIKKNILNFFIKSVSILSILFLNNIFMDCTYAVKSNGESSKDQDNKVTKNRRSSSKNDSNHFSDNSTDESIIFINRRTSSFSKIKNFIPRIPNSLKRRKSKRKNTEINNSFQSYINKNIKKTSVASSDTDENKEYTSDTNDYNFTSSSDSYSSSSQQRCNDIEGSNIFFNRFVGKVIQITSDSQPYLIETLKESPDRNIYMDMNYYFITRIASLIHKNSYEFFYKGYYAPQIIVLGSLKLDADSENNKIIYDNEYCIYETILSTTCKKLINYMLLRIGEPFKNIHKDIEIEPHYYYIRGMYLSICILKKIQLTIIYPEKNVSHSMIEINNLNYKSVSKYLKNINVPIDFAKEVNDYKYNDYEKKILFIIESQRHIFDQFDTIVLELGHPSLYGLNIINIQMNYNFIEAINNLKFSLYSFESNKPESIHNRKITYKYNGYYILAISILLSDQIFTRYIKINDFVEATSESFDLITNQIKDIIYNIFEVSSYETNSFVMLLSLLVCYNQKDSFISHENILKLEPSTEVSSPTDIVCLEEIILDPDDSLQFKDLYNCDKLDNIYENSSIYLAKNQKIKEVDNIEDEIKHIDLLAVSIPSLLIINIINAGDTANNIN